jgi:dihydrofolate reductase
MRRIISTVHISLDGFVSGPNGEMNWINVGAELFDHIGKRISQTDTVLYGRVTYEMMQSYWPSAGDEPGASKHDIEHSNWYNKASKIMLSRTMKGANFPNTKIISNNLMQEISKIKQSTGSEILVFGSPTATHSLIQQNLVDGYWLFVNPVILGKGIPLFTGITHKADLTLLSTRQFTSGVTELNYTVDRD